ncbi:M20/M25/M40 family metallo-hydrolase [Mariniluteicoccus endophyticus]
MSEIAAAVDRVLPSVRETLAELIAIPSISSDPERADDVRRSADFVAQQLRDVGCPDVEVVTEGGHPAVIGRFPAPEGRPTVTLYAHHDVQPTGDEAKWTTGPFEATERGDRLYARGAADDKGGIGVHLAALRAFDGKPPVGVTVFVEGEEEIGSPSLGRIFEQHGHKLACDVFVIADSGNWEVGKPAFTSTLRGMADITVEVATLDHALHSGQYGGLVPDAMLALVRTLDSLWDERGNVAVEGLVRGAGPDLDYPQDRLRAETGVLDGAEFIGDDSAVSRMWTKPSVTIIGVDTTPVAKASNTLIPSARAKLSLRIGPGDDPVRAQEAVARHLEAHAPFGARITVTGGDYGHPCEIPFEGPYAEAAQAAYTEGFGVEPVRIGMGGSIPLTQEFMQLHPDAMVLVTAVVDPDSRMHGIDESLHLGDFAKACRAEALFLKELADRA